MMWVEEDVGGLGTYSNVATLWNSSYLARRQDFSIGVPLRIAQEVQCPCEMNRF